MTTLSKYLIGFAALGLIAGVVLLLFGKDAVGASTLSGAFGLVVGAAGNKTPKPPASGGGSAGAPPDPDPPAPTPAKRSSTALRAHLTRVNDPVRHPWPRSTLLLIALVLALGGCSGAGAAAVKAASDVGRVVVSAGRAFVAAASCTWRQTISKCAASCKACALAQAGACFGAAADAAGKTLADVLNAPRQSVQPKPEPASKPATVRP